MSKRKVSRRRANRNRNGNGNGNGGGNQTKRTQTRRALAQRHLGRYEVLHTLGTGGMAEVFKARLSGAAGFQRDVVLKRLLAANNDDQEFVNMFTDEARILGALHHPNIVQALDFGVEDNRLFLVLEYLEGPSLSRVLNSGRAVAPAVVAYIGREICRALDYMHRAVDADGTPLGLVHRDVTPSNVIVTPEGTVKLLDFGIAKFAKALQSTHAGVIKGKTGYLAPELLGGGTTEIDGRVDLFALGTLLHELLTGQRLFAAANDLAIMQNILHAKVPPPSRRRGDIPAALDRIVLRALERDPSKRYARASDMGRELDEIVVATGLRMSHVVSFVREVEAWSGARSPAAQPQQQPQGNDLPTRLDRLMPVRLWMDGRSAGRRAALVTGLSLALGAAGAFGWGLRPHAPRAAAAAQAARAAPQGRRGDRAVSARALGATVATAR